MKVEQKILSVNKLMSNKGQIEGLPANPRIIKDDKFEKLVNSIKENPEMLNLRELLVTPYNDKYIIIGGNMRYKAMKHIGYKEAPCKIITDVTVEQLKAYIIKDNNGFGEWDFDMLHTDCDEKILQDWGIDIESFEFSTLEKKEAFNDDFDKDKDQIKLQVKTDEVWQLGNHILKCGDSTKQDTYSIIKDKVNLIITDVPQIEEIVDTLNIMSEYLDEEEKYYILTNKDIINKSKLGNVKQTIIWNKSLYIPSWKDYFDKHEEIQYGYNEEKHYFNKDKVQTDIYKLKDINVNELKADELRKILNELIELTNSTVIDAKNVEKDFLFERPVPLIGKFIENSTKENELILDPFGGTGSTLIAAEQLNRKCITIEKDEFLCSYIIARWEKLTGKKAKKIKIL